MSVRKLYNGHYQAKLKGPDGRYLTRVFRTKGEAEKQDHIWKQQKREGSIGTIAERQLTVDDFFALWHKDLRDATTPEEDTGWRDLQAQLYRDYIGPVIGNVRLKRVTPQMAKRVLNEMAKKGKSNQTRRHVFGMMRKMFSDAVEDYQFLTFCPVLRKLKPEVPVTEAPHLKHIDQMKRLLAAVEGEHYELAVWIQLFAGLRIGEAQALQWEDLDLEAGTLSVRQTFVRKRNCIRPYPKGRKQFTLALPPELWEKLKAAKGRAVNGFVVNSQTGTMLQYKSYLKALRGHCKALGLSTLGTHGLRHTTTSLYMQHGASKDDMRELFSHSSGSVTERYVHGQGSKLKKVAAEIRIFGGQKRGQKQEAPSITQTEGDKKGTKLVLIHCNSERNDE